MSRTPEIQALANGILAGDRASLSRGITLVESTLEMHVESSERLLELIMPQAGTALRVAITGAPGVGKSTLIEVLGMQLVESGARIAVLPVDPSSPQTGGSILGDKTRMPRLAKHPNTFIRPSPSGTASGGIARTTRSAILLCEAAGYNPILIETVGSGQGDYAVRNTVDIVLLLVLAHAGDELQGIKRGILETADLIAVTKADGELKDRASAAAKAYRRALGLYSSRFGTPEVLVSSATQNEGITDIWKSIKNLERTAQANGHLEEQRQQHIQLAVLETAKTVLLADFEKSKLVQKALQDIRKQVAEGKCTVHHAARRLLQIYRDREE